MISPGQWLQLLLIREIDRAASSGASYLQFLSSLFFFYSFILAHRASAPLSRGQVNPSLDILRRSLQSMRDRRARAVMDSPYKVYRVILCIAGGCNLISGNQTFLVAKQILYIFNH